MPFAIKLHRGLYILAALVSMATFGLAVAAAVEKPESYNPNIDEPLAYAAGKTYTPGAYEAAMKGKCCTEG
jgi:hypothetical protein